MSWRHGPKHNPSEFDIVSTRIFKTSFYQNANNDAKIAFLRFAIKALKTDIMGSSVSNILYEDVEEDKPGLFPIDSIYYDLELTNTGVQEIPFVGNTVISLPYDREKLFDAALDIENEGFHIEKGNYEGLYFPELKLILVINGRHHSAAAFEDGAIRAAVYPLTPLFDTLTVDGRSWYIDGKAKYAVCDTRFALIYAFAQKIHTLERDMGIAI